MNLKTSNTLPMVSVIIPIYNVEAYLRECIDSVVNQTYPNLEIILVDDGSPDNCGAICDEYAQADPRIKVVHQPNLGVAAARNTGLDQVTGEFVSFIDSDDFIASNMIETLLNRLISVNADLAICDVAICNDRDNIWSCDSPITDRIFTISEFVEEYQAWQYIGPCNKLFRRFLFDQIRYPVGYLYEDNAVIHHILGLCKTIVTIPVELYFYRQSPNSIMRSTISIKCTDDLTALADKTQYAFTKKWIKFGDDAAYRYSLLFFEMYFRFSRSEENQMYFDRMDASLKKALPYLVRSSKVSLRHKIYLSIIRISPRLFILLQRLVNKK